MMSLLSENSQSLPWHTRALRRTCSIIATVALAVPVAIATMALTIAGLAVLILFAAFLKIIASEKQKKLQDYIVVWQREGKSVIRATLTYFSPTSWTNPDKVSQEEAQHTPVILVHGYLHNSSAWRSWRSDLKKNHHPVFTVDLGAIPQGKSIAQYADKLTNLTIDFLHKAGNKKEVEFIGHSMGGVVIYAAAKRLQEQGIKVKAIATLGSPLAGTKLADRIASKTITGQCSVDMKTSSELKNEDLRLKIPSFHIASIMDPLVFPVESAAPINLPPGSKRKIVSRHGHLSLLYDPEIKKEVIDFIKAHD
jgi:triacylglycerol lipase